MNGYSKFQCYKNKGCHEVEHESLISIHYWDDDTIFIEDKKYPISEIPACIITALNENKEAGEERKIVFSITLDDSSFDHEEACLEIYDCNIIYIKINGVRINKADIPENIAEYIQDWFNDDGNLIDELVEKLSEY